MSIYIYTGRPRHGKTYELARIAIKKLKNKERIYSNLKFNLGKGKLKKYNEEIIGDWRNVNDREDKKKQIFYWQNLHEIEHFSKGNIFMDEAQRYFNARQWDQLSVETEMKLQQHGKDDLNIYGTTQHHSRIDVSLRHLVEIWYHVETIFGSPNNNPIFLGIKIFKITGIEGIEYMEPYMQTKLNPESKMQIPTTTKIRIFRKSIATTYDTRAKIGSSIPMPLVHRERTCEECGKIMVSHS